MTNDTSVGETDTSAAAAKADVVSQQNSGKPSAAAEPLPGFDSFGLSAELLQAITEAGYKTPTPIQAKGIPPAMARRDLIGIAQTGTGKTASFALPMIELLARGRARARMPRSLILEPTRELAAQVAESFEQYTKYHKLSMALLIGGVSFDEQDRKLDRGADILIATPGRLLDHFERGKLMLTQVQILVIDEADRMLDMGFIPDIERICKLIPFTRQTLFYSATMPTEIRRLTEQFLQNPVQVEVARPASTAENIDQSVVDVPANDWAKREALRRLIREAEELKNAIVFCNRKHDVDIVSRSLQKHGFNAGPLHGDLDQSVRTRTLDRFRSGDLQILVASDVAARGLDIPDVSHVFNFDVPYHPDDYVHRVGRTGRAGRHGVAFMLVSPRDEKYLEAIERLTKSKLSRRTLEGLAEAVQDRPARRDRDRTRGGRRDDRRNRRDRPVKPHGQVASMEPVRPKHKDGGGRPSQQSAAPAGRRTAEPAFSANLDQLPAFLLRPVPLPKAKPAAKAGSVKKPAAKKAVKKAVADKPAAKAAAKMAASADDAKTVGTKTSAAGKKAAAASVSEAVAAKDDAAKTTEKKARASKPAAKKAVAKKAPAGKAAEKKDAAKPAAKKAATAKKAAVKKPATKKAATAKKAVKKATKKPAAKASAKPRKSPAAADKPDAEKAG